MKYLKFLGKMTDALSQGGGIDSMWKTLPEEERRYLAYNEARFAVIGGKQTFIRRLATALDIPDAENIPEVECRRLVKQSIAETIQAANARVLAIPGFIDMEHASKEQKEQIENIRWELMSIPGFRIFIEALSSLTVHGDGKAWESLDFDFSALKNNFVMQGMPCTPEELLKDLVSASNAKAFHYFLHESPEKEKYHSALMKGFPSADEEFEPLTHPILRQILDDKKGQMLAEVLPLMSNAQRHIFFSKEPDFHYKYGNDVARVALKYYPRNDIGKPHPNADEGGIYTKLVRGQDGGLAQRAAALGDSDLLQYIFSRYHDPHKIAQLIEMDGMAGLTCAAEAGYKECVAIILNAITDANRKEITNGFGFKTALFQALKRHDIGMVDAIIAAMPAEAERSDSQKREILLAQLEIAPDKVKVSELRQILQTQDAFDLSFICSKAAKTSAIALKKLIEAVPQGFSEYLNRIKDEVHGEILPEERQHILKAVPDSLRPEAEAALAQARIYDSSTDKFRYNNRWEESYGADTEWVKALPEEIREQNPHGFDYKTYQKLLPLMETACRIEGNEGAALNAYKMATLFGNINKAEEYLTKFAARDEHQPIHDALLFDMPKSGVWDQQSWRQFAMRDGMGPRALRLMALAPKIEESFHGKPSSEWSEREKHQFRQLTLEQLYELARKNAYKGAAEHPKLADLCIEYGVPENKFDEARTMLTRNDLPEKHTPDINIDGANLGFPGFHFRRVEPSNPWCAFIGKLVNCCNYFGGATEEMARAQIEHPDCSLYVLTNRDGEPIAKCTGWMSKKGNFVFNAWERLSPSYDKFCEPFLLAAAIQVMERNPKIERVTLGANKGNAPFTPVMHREEPTEPQLASQDANMQYEVATQEKLALAKTKLQQLAKKHTRKPKLAADTVEAEEQNIWVLRHQRGNDGVQSLSA